MATPHVRVHASIDELGDAQWNALNSRADPFLQHAFLSALEHNGCVGERFGWIPRHLGLWEGDRLVGAAPLYLKDNSYGEFVFDHAWADAYQRHGHAYYPKLVSAIPYTPASGRRLLLAEDRALEDASRVLLERALMLAEEEQVSSLHWLFVTEGEDALLRKRGFLPRLGCQFHWHNRGYPDFDAFLAALTAKRRKEIRRERRKVREAGVRFRVLRGDEVDDAQWQTFARLYARTFEEHYSLATLNEGFFREVGVRMGRHVVLILAYSNGACVAGALFYRSDDTLYGRHWGSVETFDSLHFETCYYQGIDYCIREGLQRFEPGAQGEHKVRRGFLPSFTFSDHWIADEGFRTAIADFLDRETPLVRDYAETLGGHSPYKEAT